MSRKSVDLTRLPQWLQYLIAVAIIAVVVAAAWIVGRDQPVPAWIETYLIPALAWFGLILIVLVVVDWFRQRRK
jgi:uncharacterized membrane protein